MARHRKRKQCRRKQHNAEMRTFPSISARQRGLARLATALALEYGD